MEYQNYIQAYDDYFWKWEENEQVLAIPNSSTIAYRKPVAEILNSLALGGLPPFGSILLALVAMSEQMPENSLGEIGELMEEAITENHLLQKNPIIQHLQILGEAMQFLQLLQKLPSNYKTASGRLMVFRSIFEDVHNKIPTQKSELIASHFGDTTTYYAQGMKAYSSATFLRDFRTLGLLLQHFPDTEAILKAVGGLPELDHIDKILEEEYEAPNDGTKLDFIEELIEDDRTFHIGALLRTLWAGLKIPVNNAMPSDQKYGGVADLTNKGDFDKLLLSEFANEDIILLSRLANNEALYLNKETPPIENAFERIILVDVSIKNWGTPKTLMHALSLAIAKHPKSGEDCKIFALGDSFVPIAYDSIDKVAQSLLEVDISLHCANGLTSFLETYNGEKSLELFFISSPASLKLPAMQRLMQQYKSKIRYWIQVDAEGQIDFYKNWNSGKKHLQHIQLDLDVLWKPRPKRKKQRQEEENVDFPRFYPILYPLPSNPRRVMFTATEEKLVYPTHTQAYKISDIGDIYYISAEKQLFKLENALVVNQKGTALAMERVPPFTEVAIGKQSSGDEIVLFFNAQDRQLIFYNLRTQQQQSAYFNKWQSCSYHNFIFLKDYFYYLGSAYNNQVWRFDPISAKIELVEYDKGSLIEVYKKRQSIEYTTRARISVALSILKNIYTLHLNQRGNLVLNGKHELMMNNYGVFKFELNTSQSEKATANKTNYGFSFADGTKVFIDRAGIMTLESSDETLSKIYVPMVLDTSLAIATEDSFAGNQYYLPTEHSLKLVDTRMIASYLRSSIQRIENSIPK